VIAWILHNMAAASLVILLLLALRGLVAARLGAGAAYALWLLPALRFLLPPLPFALPGTAEIMAPVILLLPEGGGAAASAASGGAFPWFASLVALWAGGALLFLAWQWRAYRAFLARLSLDSRSIGVHRGLPLIASGAVAGPLAVGLLDRRIVVPADFAQRYTEEERALALAHEHRHHARGDIWWNLLALLLLALNWFNPLAWLAFRAFRADQELACDAAVAAALEPRARAAYAGALVKSASRIGLVSACPLNHADQLKRRLKMMTSHRKSALRRAGGAGAFASLGAAALALGTPLFAQSAGADAPRQERRERVMVIETKGEGTSEVRAGGDRVVRIRRGPDGAVELPRGCADGDALANVDEQDGDRRTRILLCGPGEAGAGNRVEALERARARIAENQDLGAEHRARVLAALDRAIAEARAR
jgi:beta-lactamase regulating signal transducer with metallopeptidase domain